MKHFSFCEIGKSDDSHNNGLNLLVCNMLSAIASHPTWVCGLKLFSVQRGVNVYLSHPTWVCGLKHYKAICDLAMLSYSLGEEGRMYLSKGIYVLEHSYHIACGGTYETGLATIQCAYAPEYASHSAGGTIVVNQYD